MKSFFNDLFEYSRYMNNELISAMVQHGDTVSEKSLKWMNHILNAHQVWNSRVEKGYPPFGVWEMHELDALAGINESNYQRSLAIVHRFEWETVIEYKTTSGVPFKNTVRDILFHVINHSTYHRGQIAADFRNTGLEPLVTDWVVWRRKN